MGFQPLKQVATEGVVIAVSFDANGVPQTATGQKQVIDDAGIATNDGAPTAPVISPSAQQNYLAAIKAAEAALEQQILAENYPNGSFVAWTAPVAAVAATEQPAQ